MSKQQEIVDNVTLAITAIKGASKIVKEQTQLVVLDFLTLNHIGGLDRIPYLATRMVAVMTGLEKQGFKHFVSVHFPLAWDDTAKMFKDKPIKDVGVKAECKGARDTFLEEFENNYWLWITQKVKGEDKDIDWMKRLDSALASAQNPEKGGFSLKDVLAHVIEKEGIKLDMFLDILAPQPQTVVEDVVVGKVVDVAVSNDEEIAKLMAEVA